MLLITVHKTLQPLSNRNLSGKVFDRAVWKKLDKLTIFTVNLKCTIDLIPAFSGGTRGNPSDQDCNYGGFDLF